MPRSGSRQAVIDKARRAARRAEKAARAAAEAAGLPPPPPLATPERTEAPLLSLGDALSRLGGTDAPPGGENAATGTAEASGDAPAASPTTAPDTGWCKYAGFMGSGVVVKLNASFIRKGGHQPQPPDDDSVDYLRKSIEDGLRESFGDTAIPWWAAIGMAWGGVYASQSIGAKPLPPSERPSPPPVPVHGLGVPPPPRVAPPPPPPPPPPAAAEPAPVTLAPAAPAAGVRAPWVSLSRVQPRGQV